MRKRRWCRHIEVFNVFILSVPLQYTALYNQTPLVVVGDECLRFDDILPNIKSIFLHLTAFAVSFALLLWRFPRGHVP